MSCFFDVQKCFDSINHDELIKKLSLYGIQGTELAWFKNYLKDRQQFVSLNGEISSPQIIKTGVPQGSALGPFLFLIFINDLPQHITNAHSNIFADDSVIYTMGKSANETRRVLQESVLEAGKWFNNNNLPVNLLKTICMLTSHSSNLNKMADADNILNLSLHDAPLSQVTVCPYLGIQLDQCLKWDAHVLNLCKKVASKLSVLNRLRNILSREMLSRQYLLCIQPCIDYAISVWGTYSKQLKDMITRLQHRAARIVTGIFDFINFRAANLMENLGWHSFDKRRDYFTATMMFKCINGLAPLRLTNELSVIGDAHSANTRASSNGNILVPMPHVEQFRNSFKYRGAVLWNTLPRDIREAQNIDEFKYRYRKHYLTKRLNYHPYSVFYAHIWFYDATMVISTVFLNPLLRPRVNV